MIQKCSYPIRELLPHTPPMILLDEVLGWDKGSVTAALTIRPGIPFFSDDKEGGVPSYVGLEYMAQTCGAFAGLEALTHGQPVRLGFLLGTRNYHAAVDRFRPGERLEITAQEMLRQEFMGVFACRIMCNDIEVASAQLNLYQPEDVDSILKGP